MRPLRALLILGFLPWTAAAQELMTVRGPADVIDRLRPFRDVVASWRPDLRVVWVPDETGVSFAPLFDGSADLLLSPRAIDPWERSLAAVLSLSIHEDAVALDGVSVVVHPENALESLSLEEVQTLFSGTIRGWYGFGGTERAIRLLAPSPSSGEYQALKRISPGGDFRLPPSAEVLRREREVVSIVASDPRAVGLVSTSFAASGVREVPLRASASEAPVEPSADSVEAGLYPWSRTLWMYRRGAADESLRRLLSFLLSSEGQREIAKVGFIPIPADRPFLRTLPAREKARAAAVTRVSFASGIDRPDDTARELLSRAARSVSEVWITGHAGLAEDRAPVGLSERRAKAVEAFLVNLDVTVRGAEGVGADGGDRSGADVWWISRR